MRPGIRQILCFLCIVGFWGWSGSAYATTWQELRDAGLAAFDSDDYPQAVAQFEEAYALALEAGAAAQDRGLLLEHLATAYLADSQHQQAQETIALWDGVLAENEDQAWAADHQAVRDRLAAFVSKSMEQAPDDTDSSPEVATSQQSEGDTGPDTPLDAYAVHLASARTEDLAVFMWDNLKELHPKLLAGKSLALKQIDLGDRGLFVRVVAYPYESEAAARSACAEFEKKDQYCVLVSDE